MTVQQETRAPFAAQTTKADKRNAGRTEADQTPLELRSLGEIEDSLRDWVYERISRQLGKYAAHIERIQVSFGDENGPKGGVDKRCLIHLTVSKLPPVVVETRGETDREAFDLAAGRAERAMRHSVQRHGFHTHSKHRDKHSARAEGAATDGENGSDGQDLNNEPLLSPRVGQGTEQIEALAERPEKIRRDLQVDTAEAGVTSTDRKVGYGHTGKRNTKLNTEGMAYKLEDSTTGTPSRKSTRGGANRVKADAPLTLRARSGITSAKSKAARSITRGQ